jgi:hypothetical protein
MYADAEHTVLDIELPSFDQPVLYEVHRDVDVASSQSQALQKPIEWFLSRMSEAERTRLDRLISGRVQDITYVALSSRSRECEPCMCSNALVFLLDGNTACLGRQQTGSASDRNTIWRLRYALRNQPSVLRLFLMSTDWFNPLAVAEAYRLLYLWAQPTPLQALQLLDHRFPDPKVSPNQCAPAHDARLGQPPVDIF